MTYLIDEKGKIAAVWPKVKPEGHAEEILAAVDASLAWRRFSSASAE